LQQNIIYLNVVFVAQAVVVIALMNICNRGGKVLQDEKKLERLMEIQEEITKLMNQMYKIKEKIYFLTKERDSL